MSGSGRWSKCSIWRSRPSSKHHQNVTDYAGLKLIMKAHRTLNLSAALEAAKAGRLKGAELRKAIKAADDLGKATIASELRLFLVESASFAGDAAPAHIRDRVAQGISALTGMGE